MTTECLISYRAINVTVIV